MGSGGACAPARRGALPAQNDLPRPGSPSTSRDPAVDQGAGVFEAMVHDLRAVLRLAQGRPPQCSTAAPCAPPPERPPWRLRRRQAQGRARRSTRRWTDTLGHLLALRVTPATEQDRKQVETLAARRCKRRPEKASSLPTWTAITPGERAAAEAQARGIRLEVVKHLASKKGFVLLPGRWVVERSLAWASRFLGAL